MTTLAKIQPYLVKSEPLLAKFFAKFAKDNKYKMAENFT